VESEREEKRVERGGRRGEQVLEAHVLGHLLL
jgi:hypothetical protein